MTFCQKSVKEKRLCSGCFGSHFGPCDVSTSIHDGQVAATIAGHTSGAHLGFSEVRWGPSAHVQVQPRCSWAIIPSGQPSTRGRWALVNKHPASLRCLGHHRSSEELLWGWAPAGHSGNQLNSTHFSGSSSPSLSPFPSRLVPRVTLQINYLYPHPHL